MFCGRAGLSETRLLLLGLQYLSLPTFVFGTDHLRYLTTPNE